MQTQRYHLGLENCGNSFVDYSKSAGTNGLETEDTIKEFREKILILDIHLKLLGS